MFQNLINRFIAWFYNKLEAEKVRRIAALRAEKDAKRDDMQRKNAAYLLKMLQEKQDRCTHKKGGKIIAGYVDYNVSTFTFVDGRLVVKCLTCSKEWSKASNNLVEGMKMSQNSSNSPSSCERSIGSKDQVQPERTDHQPQETEYEPLAPFVSKGYIKWWEKLEKKLARRKKGKK